MLNKSLLHRFIPIIVAVPIAGYENIQNGEYGILIFKLVFISLISEGLSRYYQDKRY